MSETNRLLPFDLETALREPGRVRDNDGRRALQIAHFPKAHEDCRVIVLWEKDHGPILYAEDGHLFAEIESPRLYLAPRTVRRRFWVRPLGIGLPACDLSIEKCVTMGDEEPAWYEPDSAYLGPAVCIDDREVEE